MTEPENIEDAIELNALGPKKVQVGNQSVEQHSLSDLIAANQHLAAKSAAKRPGFGLRYQKIVPPGCG